MAQKWPWDSQGIKFFYKKCDQNLQRAAKVFTEVITNYANKSLNLKHWCKPCRICNKPWYNETCGNLNRHFKHLASLTEKSEKHLIIINQYQKIGTEDKYTQSRTKNISGGSQLGQGKINQGK